MLKKLPALLTGLIITLTAYAASVELADRHPDSYTVRRGDTLWDISARFLRKPWLWPEIWQVNPQVKNPHLIYPGDVLNLGIGSGGPYLSTEQPRVRESAIDEAIPPIPLSAIKQFLKHARILGEDEFEHAPHVVGIEENHLRGTAGQLIYVRGLNASVGQKLAVLRPVGRYYDLPPEYEGQPRDAVHQEPDDRAGRPGMLWHHGPGEFTLQGRVRFLGYEVMEFGNVEVTRSGDPASLLVAYSDFEVKAGDLVLPIDEKPYDDQYIPHSPAKVADGMRVIAFTDAMNAVGRRQVVALSRGGEQGVGNGQVYSIYQTGEVVRDSSEYPPGSARRFFNPKDSKVRLPPEFIGHVMIFRTFQSVSYGLVMDGVKPVKIGNWLHDPDSTP
ncbi:MAG: LysM domain-containing protein [Dokdonella sp.]